MSFSASRLLLSVTRSQLLPAHRSGNLLLRYSSTSVATDSTKTSVCTKSADPEWIKMAVQQMLQHCDNNGTSNNNSKGVGTTSTTTSKSANAFIASDAATNFKKKAVSDEDLEKALQSYKYQVNESKLCVSDCTECENTKDFLQEIQAAESAVQSSVEGFLDLIESLRNASPDQQERYLKIREDAVAEIKDVRSALNALKQRVSN